MSLEQANAFMNTLPTSQKRNALVSRWFTALDNYTPSREFINGHAVSFYLPTTRETGYVLFGVGKLPLAAESAYVVQNLEKVVSAMYPVAWHGPADEFGSRVVLNTYPTDLTLPMGPKRAYHIHLRAIDK